MNLLFAFTFLLYILSSIVYLVYFFSQKKKARTAARSLLLGAAITHTIYIAACYFNAGHTPITTNHETISFFAWALAWGFLSFRWRYQVKNFGTFVSVMITLLMLVASLSSQQPLDLPPVLRSFWFPVHASLAMIAYAFMAMGFCGGIMYLLQEREIKSKRFGMFYSRLPSLEALDHLNHHSLVIGFSMLTAGLITGSFWAKQAWGSYWQWDPKETWSLITWIFYAILLHQRLVMGWRRRRAAIMAIIGFAVILFTLWGVTTLLGGAHPNVG